MTFLVAALLTGCAPNQEPNRVCTLIGCNDGLNVTVTSSLQRDYSVAVKSGAQTLHTFTCRAGQPCMAFLYDQAPTNITLEIATGDRTITRDFTPEYVVSRPNGPGCDPECRQATVTVSVD